MGPSRIALTARPLDGITVVSVEQAVAGPYATRQLADLGARVIKIERPGEGDFARHYDTTVRGQSSYFVWINRSKESLTLDIKAPAGQEILHSLLAGADVFVQNLGPGAAHRLGLDAAALGQRYPGLIACDISGYGETGPWSERKAYDLLVQAEAGVVALTGPVETPSRVGISIADIAAAMYAYSGILTALYRRATTGSIAAVRVALFEALAEWMGAPAYYTAYGGAQPLRAAAEHATIAPYGPYETHDGSTVMIAVQSQREWLALCDVLGDPELALDPRFRDNPARVANRVELNQLLGQHFGSLDTDQAIELLDRGRIANARLRDVNDFLAHPSLHERGRWLTVDSPGGPIDALRPPAEVDGVEPRMGAVPALGQHTAAILAELGLDADRIAELRALGVV
jgi:formyl-CoA transferase